MALLLLFLLSLLPRVNRCSLSGHSTRYVFKSTLSHFPILSRSWNAVGIYFG